MRIRIASLTLVTVLAGLFLVTPPAQANGGCAVTFSGGDGIFNDPYLVTTRAQLNDLITDPLCWDGDYYTQLNDISMQDDQWTTTIGTADDPFTGNYDGNGFVITDLDIISSASGDLGLFGTVGNSGTVRNLGFAGSVSGTGDVGGLVGKNEGTIEKSFVAGSGSIRTTGLYVGGLVGHNSGGTIIDSYARVAVTSSMSSGGYPGGLVGLNLSGGMVTDSFATGSLTGVTPGGLVGRQASSTAIDSYWDIQTSGTSSSEGGSGKTTEQLTSLSTFSSWSIGSGWSPSTTWSICSTFNSGYPFLSAFYPTDPCPEVAPLGGSSTHVSLEFTFSLPNGRECTAISPVTVVSGTSYELPGEDAACAVDGSEVSGWRIPGQSAAFAPGRRVEVSGSQQFTAVLEYSWVNIVFDANVATLDQCFSEGNNSPMRATSWSVPRELLLTGEVPVPESPPCTPPGHSLIGWSTEPTGNRTPLSTLPPPAVDNDGNAANTIHLYAIWAAS